MITRLFKEIFQNRRMTFSVKNVGKARTLLEKNNIRIIQSDYIGNGNSGYIIIDEDDFRIANHILKSFGIGAFDIRKEY
ncbi:MAG: hypothetical protein ABSG25_12265 [Bryobacteraceae bacterium]